MKIELQEPTVVLRGKFNPAIFHPSWFARHQLIRDNEVPTDPEGLLVMESHAQFTVGGFNLLVNHDRFQVGTSDLALELPLADLVRGVFGLLDQTPLTVLGVNRLVHFKLANEAAWEKIARHLAPHDIWADLISAPKMLGVGHEAARTDGLPGRLTVHVMHSGAIQSPAVVVNINHHIDLAPADAVGMLDGVLDNHWARLQRESVELSERLLSRCFEEVD